MNHIKIIRRQTLLAYNNIPLILFSLNDISFSQGRHIKLQFTTFSRSYNDLIIRIHHKILQKIFMFQENVNFKMQSFSI